MIDKLVEMYGDFHDALILKTTYDSHFNYYNHNPNQKKEVILEISCFNLLRNYERDLIRIVFDDVIKFQYKNYEGMVFSFFWEEQNDIVNFDFDPIILSNGENGLKLRINPDSDCLIQFKKMSFEIIE